MKMNKTENFIKQYTKVALKSKNMFNQNTFDELVKSSLDEYKLNLSSGLNNKQALNKTISSINDALDFDPGTIKNPYNFSLSISSFALIIGVILMLLGILVSDVLYTFSILYPICFIIFLFIFIYVCITHKKRNWFDFLISGLLLLATLIIFIETLVFFYRARTGDFYYSLFYDFPGILHFNRHILVNVEPLEYEISNSIMLFDPILIISFICFAISLLFVSLENENKKKYS